MAVDYGVFYIFGMRGLYTRKRLHGVIGTYGVRHLAEGRDLACAYFGLVKHCYG